MNAFRSSKHVRATKSRDRVPDGTIVETRHRKKQKRQKAAPALKVIYKTIQIRRER